MLFDFSSHHAGDEKPKALVPQVAISTNPKQQDNFIDQRGSLPPATRCGCIQQKCTRKSHT